MQQLEDLGFKIQRSYVLHDDTKKVVSLTRLMINGNINIDTTFAYSGEFISQEILINGWLDIIEFKENVEKLFDKLNN